MKYTLEWADSARDEMQEILDTHPRKLPHLKDAYQILVGSLQARADQVGESRYPEVDVWAEDRRVAFIPPLLALFDFDATHKHVRILSMQYLKEE